MDLPLQGIRTLSEDECRELEPRSQKCVFLGHKPDDNFGCWLWDLETRQVVQSSDVIVNESIMHKLAKFPIKLGRVTFSDMLTHVDNHNTQEQPHGKFSDQAD